MGITKAFEAAFRRKEEKGWEKIYVVVDIHDTILRACYESEERYAYLPYAREALQLLSWAGRGIRVRQQSGGQPRRRGMIKAVRSSSKKR